MNPLVIAANPIFCSIPRLREMLVHPDPNGLRETQLVQIADFEKSARKSGVSPETITVARYALCTFIDEAIAATPWGGTAEWVRNSLLVSLHGETGGGEKFFQLLNRMAGDPGQYIDLLEFYYICLALGFEGRFRVIEGGKTQLDGVREKLAEMIKRQRGEYERDLSKQWRGESVAASNFGSLLPLWVSVAAAVLLLVIVYVFYLFRLNAHSDMVAFASINPPKAAARASQKNVPPRLSRFLADEVARGLVVVRDEVHESVVTVRGDGMFDSGSTELKPEYGPLLHKITDALNQVSGQIVVIGHTDNIPSRSIQYPSNWHLSKGRAVSVARLVKSRMADQRAVTSEGRGESEPVAANDSAANRALNRRVDIVLKVVS
jgi:type VI secretion system protein ImpK